MHNTEKLASDAVSVEHNTSGIMHIATPTEISDEPQGGMVMRLKTMSQAILLLGLIVAPCLAIAANQPSRRDGS